MEVFGALQRGLFQLSAERIPNNLFGQVGQAVVGTQLALLSIPAGVVVMACQVPWFIRYSGGEIYRYGWIGANRAFDHVTGGVEEMATGLKTLFTNLVDGAWWVHTPTVEIAYTLVTLGESAVLAGAGMQNLYQATSSVKGAALMATPEGFVVAVPQVTDGAVAGSLELVGGTNILMAASGPKRGTGQSSFKADLERAKKALDSGDRSVAIALDRKHGGMEGDGEAFSRRLNAYWREKQGFLPRLKDVEDRVPEAVAHYKDRCAEKGIPPRLLRGR